MSSLPKKEHIIWIIFSLETLRRQPTWLVLLTALVLVGLVGWIDYATGWEWSCYAAYAAPIVLVSWKAGRRLGFVFAFLCAITDWWADIGSNPYQTQWGYALAEVGWWFYFSVLVVAAAAVRAQSQFDRARIETLEHTHELERDILLTSEREQQRIGRDLHDSLGPQLAAIGYAASFLANDLRQRDQPEAAQAEQIRGMVGDAMSLAHDLARGIFPAHMDGIGLPLALEDLARTTSSQRGMAVSFHQTGNPHVKHPDNSIHLYRIVQEAVNNAAKHGSAKNVTIILSGSEDALHLAVVDDGKGIAPSANGTRGMGLASMRYRTQALGGKLRIESNPGGGTIISCEIPNGPRRPATPAP